MARATLTVYEIGSEGAQYSGDVTETAVVAADDLEFPNDGNTFILISTD